MPLALAALLAGTAAAPATADSIKAPPVVLAADTINSPLGFVGCIPIDGLDYCFAAQRIVDGPDAGSVSVTSRVTPWTGDLMPPVPRLAPPDTVYEQVVAPTALTRVSDHEVKVQAVLDGVGSVDLTLEGYAAYPTANSYCPDGVWGEVVSPSLAVAGDIVYVRGSVDGRTYKGGGCLPFFWTGPVVGSWHMSA